MSKKPQNLPNDGDYVRLRGRKANGEMTLARHSQFPMFRNIAWNWECFAKDNLERVPWGWCHLNELEKI